jgi:chromosome segregation ATPase
MDDDLLQYKEQIEKYNRDIAAEEKRMEKHSLGKREERGRKLEEARQTLTAAEEQKSQLAAEYRELEQVNTTLGNAGKEEDRKVTDLRSQVMRYQEIIEQCRKKESDKYIPYGNNIKTAMDRISKTKWHGEAPLGPLGLYVNAKDPEKWGRILRCQLGSHLLAFALTDARDRPILKKLLADLGKYVTYIRKLFACL